MSSTPLEWLLPYYYMMEIKYINQLVKWGFCIMLIQLGFVGSAQITNEEYVDSLKTIQLQAIQIATYKAADSGIESLPAVHNNYIISGKKNDVILLGSQPANIAEKSARQLFGKIPGVFVYDMDGSGNQVNIATRGLDPHRSWEYNVRQNGIMTNSDIYGYPASHYSPPMEAIERIELIRGTASLQYGAAFGGLVNYVIKAPDLSRRFKYETINSVGSFQTLSSFHAISGTINRLSYYAYTQFRQADTYRDAGRSEAQSQHIGLLWQINSKLKLRTEFSRSQYVFQMPGQLTDSLFHDNPRQASRTRNFYEPDIYIPAIHLDWQVGPKTSLSWVNSWLFGVRNSIMFMAFANVPDALNPQTGSYAPRQVDIDNFDSKTSELRVKHEYTFGKLSNTLIAGFQYLHNDMRRRQLGIGGTGTDYNLQTDQSGFGRDLNYRSRNIAAFVENLITISPQFQVSPGIRYESGNTRRSGFIRNIDPLDVPLTLDRSFALLGVSGQWTLNKRNNVYGGWSQAYRPVILAITIPANSLEKIDPNLKDALGHNTELGIRGQLAHNRFRYDVTLFQILYKNRIGAVQETNDQGKTYLFKTNVGDTRTLGLETFVEYRFLRTEKWDLALFSATAYMHARYIKGKLHKAGENIDIVGNKLEAVPEWTSRNGLQIRYKRVYASLQYSYVGVTFSDAFNTKSPSVTGAAGPVPAYQLTDFNLSWHFSDHFTVQASVNNLFDKSYFTKRPDGYPGAGIWPSDGRSFIITFSARI